MSAPARTPFTECARCGPVPVGTRHYGRGLCGRCGGDLSRRAPAELESYPRRTRPGPELARAALALRAEHGEPGWGGGRPFAEQAGCPPDFGITWAEIASRLGVSYAAVTRAVQRHRAAERTRR